MAKPVCVGCRRFFRPSRNGRYWTEMKPKVPGAAPGIAGDGQCTFYKVWSSDEWTCPGCGALILVGHGREAIAFDYQPDAVQTQQILNADKILVNDC